MTDVTILTGNALFVGNTTRANAKQKKITMESASNVAEHTRIVSDTAQKHRQKKASLNGTMETDKTNDKNKQKKERLNTKMINTNKRQLKVIEVKLLIEAGETNAENIATKTD